LGNKVTPIEQRVVEDFVVEVGGADTVTAELCERIVEAFAAERSPSAAELAQAIADHSGDRPA